MGYNILALARSLFDYRLRVGMGRCVTIPDTVSVRMERSALLAQEKTASRPMTIGCTRGTAHCLQGASELGGYVPGVHSPYSAVTEYRAYLREGVENELSKV